MSDARTRVAIRWASFPAAVMCLFAVMVSLNLNGSSMSWFAEDDTALVFGSPRPVRSDEFQLRTPIAISSVRQDFPSRPWIGLAQIDQAATAHGGPVREWSSVFKPQDWGYLAGSSARGFAWNWWWSFAISLIGCFALLGLITRSPALSATLAAALTFTPYAGWWTAPPPPLFLGYATLAGAALIAGWSTASRRLALLFAIAAATAGAALVLALYPPWQLSLALVVAAACVGTAFDRRLRLRQCVTVTVAAGLVAAAVVGTWAFGHREAIKAVAATYYPGHRITLSGTGSWTQLTSAPLNFWMSGHAGTTLGFEGRGGAYANASELASAWVSIPIVILAMVGLLELVFRRVRAMQRNQVLEVRGWATPAALLGAISILMAWSFLSVPTWLGKITLLDRIQPSRTAFAIGVASVFLVAVARQVTPRPRSWTPAALAAAVLLGAGIALASRANLPWDASLVPASGAALSGAALTAVLALTFLGRRYASAAALGLAIYATVSWAIINPLTHGIGPLVDTNIARVLDTHAIGSENRRVAVFGGFDMVARVRAAGYQSVSGTTLYPDTTLMAALAPADEALWNNYAQYLWQPGKEGTLPAIERVKGTTMRLTIDPCDPNLLRLVAPRFVVSERAITAACLTEIDTTTTRGGKQLWVYDVDLN